MKSPRNTRSVRLASLAGLLTAALAGCTSSQHARDAAPAPRFVIVHGAFQGAWAWTPVAAGLRAQGANVDVVELPAHGADMTSIAGATLDAYVAKVDAALDAAPEPVILVGHSMGGMIISQAAEHHPDRIAKLVYVAAFVPGDGDSLQKLAMTDQGSHLGPALVVDAPSGIVKLPTAKLADIFCADCSAATVTDLTTHYRDEPLAPLATPVHLTAANFGRVAKRYIYTQQDHAISFSVQQAMASAGGITTAATLDASHSPFLAKPDAVVTALLAAAE